MCDLHFVVLLTRRVRVLRSLIIIGVSNFRAVNGVKMKVYDLLH